MAPIPTLLSINFAGENLTLRNKSEKQQWYINHSMGWLLVIFALNLPIVAVSPITFWETLTANWLSTDSPCLMLLRSPRVQTPKHSVFHFRWIVDWETFNTLLRGSVHILLDFKLKSNHGLRSNQRFRSTWSQNHTRDFKIGQASAARVGFEITSDFIPKLPHTKFKYHFITSILKSYNSVSTNIL